MAPTEASPTDIAAKLAGEHGSAIIREAQGGKLPPDVLDSAQDLTGALADVIAAGRQLEQDRAELTRKRDLLPQDGYRRLWAEAEQAAVHNTQAAERAADRAYERLERSLQDATLPTIDPGREQLARDEAAMALSGGNPEQAALRLAQRGNAEAVAALLSPWGETLLEARGVEQPGQLLADVRHIAVARATEKPNDTPAARALRDHLGALGAAKGSAGTQVRLLTEGRW